MKGLFPKRLELTKLSTFYEHFHIEGLHKVLHSVFIYLFIYLFMSYFEHVLPWYLILMAYNAIQVHEPQAETDSLKLFWFCQIYVLSILIISTTKRGSEHTRSQYFLA